MKNKISQGQFRAGYAPQEHVMPHSMDNREAGPPSQRKRDSVQLGDQTQARPGLSGISARTKLSKPKHRRPTAGRGR